MIPHNGELHILEKMLRLVRQRQQDVITSITGGPVPDFAAYRHLRGKYEELVAMESELRTLRQQVITDDEQLDSA